MIVCSLQKMNLRRYVLRLPGRQALHLRLAHLAPPQMPSQQVIPGIGVAAPFAVLAGPPDPAGLESGVEAPVGVGAGIASGVWAQAPAAFGVLAACGYATEAVILAVSLAAFEGDTGPTIYVPAAAEAVLEVGATLS
jgi:hypothetical protein